MSPTRSTLLTLLLGLCSACVPTLYPLYQPADLVYEPGIAGKWKGEDEPGDDYWSFTGQARDDLVLTVYEDGEQSHFNARVLVLDGIKFLDLEPFPLEDSGSEFYRGHFVPTHTFYRLGVERDRLILSGLDLNWLEEALRKREVEIDFHQINKNLLLITSPTEALQRMALKAVDSGGFSDEAVLIRNGE
ncbi:MAG: hypothetical protein JSU96_17245 [Acidobacteriota bacterium]|nr:MAG: hypothetical protein JSU96_17245 [Acidobacteriota bacterium]